ncbi:YdcF family protein [Methylosinus sp. Sm6]|nr:YdcF family protein [Methylosinus sp. Sm6]
MIAATTRTLFVSATLVGVDRFQSFDDFVVPSAAEVRRASAAVVFSGAFERVDAGLRLVNAGAIPLLYISGLNANAGLRPTHIVSQFSTRNPDIADLPSLIQCCVRWGENADNTLQNAFETRCWVKRRKAPGALLLITSRRHMARALTALSSELPEHALIPYPVPDAPASGSPLRPRAFEYLKYLATIVIVHIPSIDVLLGINPPLAKGCSP